MERSRRSNVVFIHPDLGIGGAERLVLDVAIALSKKNHNVSFVTNHFSKRHAFQELKDNEFPIRVIGSWLPRSICGIFQALFAYMRMIFLAIVQVLVVKPQPDVYFVDQIPMAIPFIKWVGGKVIYYCHHPDLLASAPGGSLKSLYRLPIDWLELKGTAMADAILVNSLYTSSVFHKVFPEIKQDIRILYPSISSSYQNMIENRKPKPIKSLIPELEHSESPFVFLSVNRFHPAKKLELALEALANLKAKLSSADWDRVHLVMAGGFDPHSRVNATYFSKLVKLSANKELSSKVTFLKSPSDEMKADLVLNCNCLIYTPVNEHFGIVPLEAMAAAKPVIACNSGGPCETVLDNITGYLCEPEPEKLSEGLYKLFNNPELQTMGILGKNRLEECFSYDIFCTQVNDIFETVVYGTESLRKNVLENIVAEKEGFGGTPNATEETPSKEFANLMFSPCNTSYMSVDDSTYDSEGSSHPGSASGMNDTAEIDENTY